MKTNIIGLALIIGLILAACQSKPKQAFNEEFEKKKILALNELNGKAFLNKDVSSLKKLYACSPDSEISISNGEIIMQRNPNLKTDAENLKAFGSGQYTKAEALEPPIIRFSPDGKMAYQVIKVKLRRERIDSAGNKKIFEFIDAALTVYEKKDNCWGEVAIAETIKVLTDKK